MKKQQFYTVVILLLLLLNVGTLGYLWMNRTNGFTQLPPPRERPGDFIIKALDLDEQQQKEFHLLGRRHHVRLDSVQNEIKQAQNEMFRLVSEGVLDSIKTEELLEQIKQGEAAKHRITIAHFEEIKNILKPEQQPLFEEFMQELGNRIIAPEQRRVPIGPPPRRR